LHRAQPGQLHICTVAVCLVLSVHLSHIPVYKFCLTLTCHTCTLSMA
jgi:hypothetical protein